ncbi:MAG: succinate dehydrogenase assembly factor 2 [Hyphomicrobiaceae bacterium]
MTRAEPARSKPACHSGVKHSPAVIPKSTLSPANKDQASKTVTSDPNSAFSPASAADIDTRRRRATYRAHHRGTKEMDWLLGRYADVHLEGMDSKKLAKFERFLALPDPDLQSWILDAAAPRTPEFADLIEQIRVFHGLHS